jgi:SAM-dependent methyltransferase
MTNLNFRWMVIGLMVFFIACTNDNNEPVTSSNNTDDELSFEGIVKTSEAKGRQVWQKPNLVIDLLGELEDKTIADIGAGTGYFALRLAEKAKKVIAVEIDERFINFIDSVKTENLPEEFHSNLETRLTVASSSGLRAGEADVILMVNTYSYIENRAKYFRTLRSRMKPGGRLVVVDFKKKRIGIDYPPASQRLPLFEVENELIDAGFTIQSSDDCSLEYQYILLAMK